jgi:hypothetical protein
MRTLQVCVPHLGRSYLHLSSPFSIPFVCCVYFHVLSTPQFGPQPSDDDDVACLCAVLRMVPPPRFWSPFNPFSICSSLFLSAFRWPIIDNVLLIQFSAYSLPQRCALPACLSSFACFLAYCTFPSLSLADTIFLSFLLGAVLWSMRWLCFGLSFSPVVFFQSGLAWTWWLPIHLSQSVFLTTSSHSVSSAWCIRPLNCCN